MVEMVRGLSLPGTPAYKGHCIQGLKRWSQDLIRSRKGESGGALESGLSASTLSRIAQL